MQTAADRGGEGGGGGQKSLKMCGHPLWMVSSDINMVKSGGVVEMYMTKNFRDSNSVETVKHMTLIFINQPLNVLFQGYFSKIFENSSR